MNPKFRLEDVSVLESRESPPAVQSTVRLDHKKSFYPRCDGNGHCYGCNSAELKQPQEDIRIYDIKAA